MKRTGRTFVMLVALLMLLSNHSSAQGDKPAPPKPPTLEDMDSVRGLEALQAKSEQALALLAQISREKRTDCVSAFGDPTFCDCLRDNLPVAVSFLSYVQMVTTSKEKLGYAKLSTEQKVLVDNTLAAREVCVSKHLGVPKQ